MLIPPLDPEEYRLLESNLKRDGCREAIILWDGCIVDGHNRYEICTRNRIPFHILEVHFNSREEAIAWICYNQLGRRNITNETRKYLIGKRYEMEKCIGAHNKSKKPAEEVRPTFWDGPRDEPAGRTTERLGDEYHISKNTVQKYGTYSAMLEMLRKVVPEYVPQILNGTLKISHESLMRLVDLPPDEIRKFFRQLDDTDRTYIRYTQTRDAVTQSVQETPKQPSVKDTPPYDPDASLSSLAFTMPSWAGSIQRALQASDIKQISNGLKERLTQSVSTLLNAVQELQQAVKEEPNG